MSRKIKVMLSAMLALMMILSSVPMLAMSALEALKTSDETVILRDFVVEEDKETAAEDISVNWSYSETTTEATITYCDTTAEVVTIPSSYKGKPVVAIAAGAFYGATGLANLKTVNIAPTVQTIAAKAFDSCAQLSSVQFIPFDGLTGDAAVPDITTIGADAFYNCAALKSISVPKGVVSIGTHAFGYIYANTDYSKIENFTISGYLNTAAYKFANDNAFAFSNLYGIQTVTPVQTFSVSPAQGTIAIAEFVQLTPVFGATTPTNTFVRWSSSNKTIASVDKNGKVTGVSGGEVTITATSSDNLKTSTCRITVTGAASGSDVTALTFTGNLAATTIMAYYSPSSTLKYKVTYSTTPADAPYNAVGFTYDNTYFTVEYDTTALCYYLIPKKLTSGDTSVELKIYSMAYPTTVYDTVNVKITNNISGVQWYSFDNGRDDPFIVTNVTRFKWKYSEGRLDASAILLPSGTIATKDDIILTSSNENVAYWNANNEIVPLKDGETVLTVTTVNGGYTDTITAVLSGTGSYAVMGLAFTFGATQELTYANTYDLSTYLDFTPDAPTNKTVTWKSSDSTIVSVTDKGVISCKKRGTTVITATSKENDDMVATATITVKFAWWQWLIYFITFGLFGGKV